MIDNKPKFRLESISHIPQNISNIIKEIISEISSQNNKLQPVLALEEGWVVCVPYVCKCDIQCDCDQYCNYCDCVDYGKCKDHDPCPEYIPCSCDYDCNCYTD